MTSETRSLREYVACCPGCGAPLASTFAFSFAEWYCLDCGGKYGWFEETRAPATPELLAEAERVKQEWLNYGPHLLTGGVMLRDCAKCSNREPHIRHATAAEKERNENALQELALRVKVARV